MTQVSYNDNDLSMEISGHAGAGEPGHDLVCAAATILMRTLEAAVMDKQSRYIPMIHKGNGYVRIACSPTTRHRTRCREVFDTIYLGYELLASHYPANVQTYKTEE